MNDKIEDMITELLQGRADYDALQLLRLARTEIQNLRKQVSDLSWAVEFEANRTRPSDWN
jgi:hypothetical protein